MASVPATTLTRLLEEAGGLRRPRRRQLGPIGVSSPLFGEPVQAGQGRISGLIESAEAFGPISPVNLLQGQIRSGMSPTVAAQNRETAAGQANEPSFNQPTVGGTATALALSRLSSPASLTNPLRANIRQQ